MKIALLTYSSKPRGGVVHTLALAEALAALGQSVEVWTLSRGGDDGFFRAVDPAVTLRLVPFTDRAAETVGQRIVRSIAELKRAFESRAGEQQYDIVHAQDCISANAVTRCIRTIHHLDTFATAELIACHERAIQQPYAHICVSQAVADEVNQGWGIKPTVIPNGIESQRFSAGASGHATTQRQAWAAELGRYILTVGGIEPRKGTDDLIEAMALVQRLRPELRLVIGGGETLFDYRDYRDQVQRRAAELKVDYVLLGPVQHNRMPTLMAQADAFAFPSRKEGFGLAAMEALAAQTPVVMRDLPVLREVFGATVRYATNSQALAEQLLLAVQGRPEYDPAPGQHLAGSHQWSAVARSHVAFYSQQPRPV